MTAASSTVNANRTSTAVHQCKTRYTRTREAELLCTDGH